LPRKPGIESGMSALAMAVSLVAMAPRPAIAQMVVADGYVVNLNCSNINLAALGVPRGSPFANSGQMAFNNNGKNLFLVYTPFAAGPGSVHVRDFQRCGQKVLIETMDGPLGLAVHPDTNQLYVSHRYVNPEYTDGVSEPYERIRSAISIYDSDTGELLVENWVEGFAPSIFLSGRRWLGCR